MNEAFRSVVQFAQQMNTGCAEQESLSGRVLGLLGVSGVLLLRVSGLSGVLLVSIRGVGRIALLLWVPRGLLRIARGALAVGLIALGLVVPTRLPPELWRLTPLGNLRGLVPVTLCPV